MEVKKIKPIDPVRDSKRLPKNTFEYEKLVESLIRKKYSISAELAILRQRDTKQEEFEEYNSYAESCKLKAKELIKTKDV